MNWVECSIKTEAFINLNDHKKNLEIKLPCRLLVPSKSELGHMSKTQFCKKSIEELEKSLK